MFIYFVFIFKLSGAADFFPDHQIAAPSPNFVFSSFSTIIAKVNCWLTKVKVSFTYEIALLQMGRDYYNIILL